MKMKNSKEVNTIFRTTDYGIFKYDAKNRPINSTRVRQITKSMREVGYLNQPIKVTRNRVVIDGQHRLKAAKVAKVPILYFVDFSKIDPFDNMAATNRHSKSWSKQDYIHGLAEKGIPSYITLQNFQKKFPEFRMTEHLMMLQNHMTSISTDVFVSGKWVAKDEKLASKWATDLMKLKPFFTDGYNLSLFVRSMIEIFDKYPEFIFDEFLRKVQLRQGMIYRCGEIRSYQKMVQDLYNYHRRGPDKVFFRI